MMERYGKEDSELFADEGRAELCSSRRGAMDLPSRVDRKGWKAGPREVLRRKEGAPAWVVLGLLQFQPTPRACLKIDSCPF